VRTPSIINIDCFSSFLFFAFVRWVADSIQAAAMPVSGLRSVELVPLALLSIDSNCPEHITSAFPYFRSLAGAFYSGRL
jgi:hypothetical protein